MCCYLQSPAKWVPVGLHLRNKVYYPHSSFSLCTPDLKSPSCLQWYLNYITVPNYGSPRESTWQQGKPLGFDWTWKLIWWSYLGSLWIIPTIQTLLTRLRKWCRGYLRESTKCLEVSDQTRGTCPSSEGKADWYLPTPYCLQPVPWALTAGAFDPLQLNSK